MPSPLRTLPFALVALALCSLSADAVAQTPEPAPPSAPPAANAPAPGAAGEPLDFTQQGSPAQEGPKAGAPPAPIANAPVANAPAAAPVASAPAVAPLTASAPAVRDNAINLSVLGFVIGNIRLTYERMLQPKHGVFGEAIVAPDVLRGFDFVGVGGAVGYRFHWRGAPTSAFVGATLSVTYASGTTPTIKLGDEETVDFSGSTWTLGIAPHVGKRWVFERSGVNLTLRVGGGFAYHIVDPDPNSDAKATRNLEQSFLVADGELSVGYSF
jgi:hypothetical protein